MRISVLIIIFFSSIVSLAQDSLNWDIRLLNKINNPPAQKLDRFFNIISNTVTPIAISIPIALTSKGIFENNLSTKNNGLFLASSIVTSGLITTGIKYIANRNRPYKSYGFIVQKAKTGEYSFPSAHTSFAFATATSLSLSYPEWYVIIPSFTWAATVAYSRMYLGVHYPSDILGGIVIGVGTSFLTYFLFNELIPEFK